ncbi:MAG: hypothetical protein IJ720_02735 [Clostridia bacterium]|nr:hypothetical protein [Clostridia bacterium]MBR1704260.1 hypothetical protein [Clostridia bacterium]
MEEERRSWRWLWAVIPAVVGIIALVVALKVFWPQLTNRVPDYLVNISGTIREAKPVEELVEATWSMENQETVDAILAEPDKWQGYELTMRLTDKNTGFKGKLAEQDWFVNPGRRWVLTDRGYRYEQLPENPDLIVGPYHAERPSPLNDGTSDYKVRLVVNKEGKTPEQVQEYIDNITIDVQTTVLWKDKEVDYVMTPITWAK